MKKLKQNVSAPKNKKQNRGTVSKLGKPTADFTRALAAEIVKNLTTLGQITTRPFQHKKPEKPPLGEHPMMVDTSVLIDGRIVAVVNSGFVAGTLVIPEFVLAEVQHIADASDPLRRAKGRRGLEVVGKLKNQKINPLVKVMVVGEDVDGIAEVDRKLVALAKKWNTRLLTIDFNLAQLARAQNVKVLNINELAQALQVALVPGEQLTIRIAHVGRDREQGVGYLPDGTMVVVDEAKSRVGQEVMVMVTKVHQTPAGQLFFARLK
jgi:uncharacterized protein YacL